MGWDAQRPSDPARGLGQGRDGPGAQVFRGRHHVLRHVHLRGTAAVGQIGEPALPLHRLDHRPRPRRRPRLGRLSRLRHDLLAAAAAVSDRAVEQGLGRGTLLDRHHRDSPLYRRHLRRRSHPGSDVARLRLRGLPQVRRLRGNHPAADPDVLGAGDRRARLLRRRADDGSELLYDLAQPPRRVRGAGTRGAGTFQDLPRALRAGAAAGSRARSCRRHRQQARALFLHRVAPALGGAARQVHDRGHDHGGGGLALRDHPNLPHQVQRADHSNRDPLHPARAGRARHLRLRGLLQLPLADDPSDPRRNRALR